MRKFAPKVNFDMRLLGGRKTGAWYDPSNNEIKWSIADGLTVLLHEIGHYRLHHDKEPACCTGLTLWEEITAWLWAEKKAKKLGIPFDYRLAEHYFNRKEFHPKHPLVMINWRHQNEEAVSCVM